MAALGTEPPLPRLVILPVRRVCSCGQFFTHPDEQRRGTCDVCHARAAISAGLARFFPNAQTLLTPGAFRATR